MVIYSKGWHICKDHITYSFPLSLLKEGESMDANVFKNEVEFDKRLEAIAYLAMLNNVLERKTKEFLNFAKCHKNFYDKASWINRWQMTTKKQRINQVFDTLLLESISEESLALSKELYESYMYYFNVVNKETNKKAKYEELFNTIIQIPSEICETIKVKKSSANALFLNNDYREVNSINKVCSDDDCNLPIAG